MTTLNKRLILCCDGTWMDSDNGFIKPTLIPYQPTGSLQVPSNVTRISRALTKVGLDGKHQIIYYHSGVGSGGSTLDSLTGGLLGTGISENIREVYSFIASNYVPGDDIILIGFSRGAFTARSVAGMIKDIGLLTRDGMRYFYPIFKDMENSWNPHYHDKFPDVPFPNKPRGAHGKDPDEVQRKYKAKLEKLGMTRVYDPDGSKIRVHAVAVWDTVGSLGIPSISLFSRLGFPHSTKEYRFYDTNISSDIRYAFQALALDEHRRPFSPAVWERNKMDRGATDLRQVWFPGSHANCGGGYDDQEIANISLAWMMDQLASIGVSFFDKFIDDIFEENVQYYMKPPKEATSSGSVFRRPWKQWAVRSVYEKHRPVRPWGLGKIYESVLGFYHLAGRITRTPGLYKRVDPDTGTPTDVFLQHTNERIHRCVRVRLDLDGLDLDDVGLYKCPALLKNWELRKMRIKIEDPIPPETKWGPLTPPSERIRDDVRWVWEYVGPEEDAPDETIMIEEAPGPYERQLLLLNKGKDISRFVLGDNDGTA
ncbi:hypothetical protein F5884DRAFT_665256 [Xylogone sp. PMI_703]|nr:hypothetical protein F5884DRAFT_665256 [Xylogone sp. PMI_703]